MVRRDGGEFRVHWDQGALAMTLTLPPRSRWMIRGSGRDLVMMFNSTATFLDFEMPSSVAGPVWKPVCRHRREFRRDNLSAMSTDRSTTEQPGHRRCRVTR